MDDLSESDKTEIEGLFRTYGEAWGRRDSKTCAALFTADSDVIAIDGEVLTGPKELERYYDRQLSGPYKDYYISDVELGPIRTVAPDVALQNGTWLLNGVKDREDPVRVRVSFLCRREPVGWRYAAVRFMVPFGS